MVSEAIETFRLHARAEALSLTWGKDTVLTCDAEGRFYSLFEAGDFYQRGLSGICLHKGRVNGKRFRRAMDAAETQALMQRVWDRAAGLRPQIETFQSDLLEKILAWTPEALAADEQRFARVYQPISILPPDAYRHIVLQLTTGCSYNLCSFCNFYKNRKFKIRSIEEFRVHLTEVKALLGADVLTRKGIFLADGDALMTPQKRLLEAIGLIRQHWQLPLYSFMDAFRPRAKRPEQWRELAAHGLRRVYLGIETGDAALLAWLGKPGSPELMLDQADLIRQAGISLGLIFMIGAGGRSYAQAHRQASVDWLNRLSPGRDDLIFLSEFIPHPDQPYAARAAAEGIEPLNEAQMEAEISMWREGLKALPAKKVPYHLQELVY